MLCSTISCSSVSVAHRLCHLRSSLGLYSTPRIAWPMASAKWHRQGVWNIPQHKKCKMKWLAGYVVLSYSGRPMLLGQFGIYHKKTLNVILWLSWLWMGLQSLCMQQNAYGGEPSWDSLVQFFVWDLATLCNITMECI